MRICSGKYKNRRLLSLAGEVTRPTKDAVKEALFSSLGDLKREAYFLDLFGGSGAIALEAYSRGLKNVIVNDVNPEAYEIIKRNALNCQAALRMLKLDCYACLEKLKGLRFTYIYLDPPYAFAEMNELLTMIKTYRLLAADGIIIYECSAKTKAPEIAGLLKYAERKYGRTKLVYYRKKEEKDG